MLGFVCPRCDVEVSERFYGPCASCRKELCDKMWIKPRKLVSGKFESKGPDNMNHVATKE